MSRRWRIRLGVLMLLAAASIFLFFIGKEHQLLLDNRSTGEPNTAVEARWDLNISLPGIKPVLVKKGEVEAVTVTGPWHRLRIQVLDGEGKVARELDHALELSFENQLRLQLPLVVGSAQ